MFFHKINGIIAIALSIQPTDILFPFNLLYWFKVSSIYYVGLKYIFYRYQQKKTKEYVYKGEGLSFLL